MDVGQGKGRRDRGWREEGMRIGRKDAREGRIRGRKGQHICVNSNS